MPHIWSQDLVKKILTAPERNPVDEQSWCNPAEGTKGDKRAGMILLFKGMINLINLGMSMTNSKVAGPPEEREESGGLINLTNKKHSLKWEEHRHTSWSLFGSGLKILHVTFLSVKPGVEAASNVVEMDPVTAE